MALITNTLSCSWSFGFRSKYMKLTFNFHSILLAVILTYEHIRKIQ